MSSAELTRDERVQFFYFIQSLKERGNTLRKLINFLFYVLSEVGLFNSYDSCLQSRYGRCNITLCRVKAVT